MRNNLSFGILVAAYLAASTLWAENVKIVLKNGAQYTLAPDTLHWFQAGAQGAVVSEFSTRSVDAEDIFTDRKIQRITRIG